MTTKIVIGGREYHSRDELPAELREQFDRISGLLADKNGNGIPDGLEGTLPAQLLPPGTPPIQLVSQQIVVNGREFGSLEELPPDLRRQLSGQMATTLKSAKELDGLPSPGSTFTIGISGASGGTTISLTSLLLVLGGILIGLVIAMAVVLSMGVVK